MPITRRFLLTAAIPAFSLFSYTLGARATAVLSNFKAARTLGNPNATVHVEEWFSLTCAHCGRFAQTVFPEIKKQFIDTGKISYRFSDFPLDKIALAAAIVARSLPVDQYQPFVFALLDNLDQWAFKDGADPMVELEKFATLAGMPPERFEQVTHDVTLRDVILNEAKYAEDKYKIDSTPTFIFNGKVVVGELTIETFAQQVADAQTRKTHR